MIVSGLIIINFQSFGQTLDQYLRIAAENNPELKAYFSEYLAAMEKIKQSGALPDPEVSIGYFIRPMERYMGNQQADIQLMQMFPWFGMIGARKDEAGKMAMAQFELFQDAKNRLFYQVKNTWFELYRLEEEIRITQENLEILKTYERLALIRFQSSGSMQGNNSMNRGTSNSQGTSMGSMAGGMNTGNNQGGSVSGKTSVPVSSSGNSMSSDNSGMSDVLRIRMEIKELNNRLTLLQDSRLPVYAEFNQLLNREYNEPVTIADTLSAYSLSLERLALLDSITQNNPMLKMLDAESEAYEAQMKMARLEGLPMLGAGVNYMPFSPRTENGITMGGSDMFMPMVRLTIPIYRKKYNAMFREAELKQLAVQQRKENSVSQLKSQWVSTLRNLDDASRRIVLYREQSGLAGQTLNLLMTSYTVDGRDFEEVLRIQQQLLDYQLKLITAIVDQHSAFAMLETLTVTELN
jgi:outer membrane protein TolC